MTIPKKVYDMLKFYIQFGSGFATIIAALFLGLGIADRITNIVILCINTLILIGSLFIRTCSKCHWKAVAEDGTETDIEPIEDEDRTMGFIAETRDN